MYDLYSNKWKENKPFTSNLYKNKETYMYWVLFVVLLDLWQGLIVIKSSLFSIICQFVCHWGGTVCLGVLRGWWHVGVMALCGGCDPRVEMSWQLYTGHTQGFRVKRLKKKSAHGCKRAKYKIYCLLNYPWSSV